MWTGEQQETRQYTRNSGRDGSIVLEQRWEMTRTGGAGWRVAEVESAPERVGQENRISEFGVGVKRVSASLVQSSMRHVQVAYLAKRRPLHVNLGSEVPGLMQQLTGNRRWSTAKVPVLPACHRDVPPTRNPNGFPELTRLQRGPSLFRGSPKSSRDRQI